MKLFRKLSIFLCGLTMLCTTSCSMFSYDDSYSIQTVQTKQLENGDTEVTISFTDEDIKPVTFTIPKGDKGEEGKKGTGIANIESTLSEDKKNTIVTVTFTDASIPSETFTIPNGVSISSIDTSYDEETLTTTITISTSDGETKSFAIKDGKDGKDGVGIASITSEVNEAGDLIITITYTDPDKSPSKITFPYRNGTDGKDGRGIQSISSTERKTEYVLTVTYTDGTSEEFAFLKPSSNEWFGGEGAPDNNDNRRAKEGDYYFDRSTYKIYRHNGTSFMEWVDLANVNQALSDITITFDATTNGGKISDINKRVIKIKSGRTIPATDFPSAIAPEGKTFKGWYTSNLGPTNPISGRVTDVTPLFQDMTLYAYYE